MPQIPVIRRIATANKRADGYYYLDRDWLGDGLPLFEGQQVGAIIAGAGKGKALPLTLQAFHDDGSPLTKGVEASLPHGKTLTYTFAIQPKYFRELGRITVRATSIARPEDVAEAVVETYPGSWGMIGSDVSNPPPEPTALKALEAQTGHPLCDDHRLFLETRNGINWTWWQHPEWRTDGKQLSEDFYTDLNAIQEAQPEIGLLSDVTYLFAAGQGNPNLRYPEDLGQMNFYNAAFLRFGIPVGVDAGGNLYVQILDGTRRGEVVFLDHEYHYGLLDDQIPPQFVPDIAEGGPDKLLQHFTADEFWTHMDVIGYSLPAAPSLAAMIEQLTAHHIAMIDKLAPKWRDT